MAPIHRRSVVISRSSALLCSKLSPSLPAARKFLDVAVHVRPIAGTSLKAFQIKLGELAASHLNSAAGAGWTDGGTFSGIATQFDNPSTEVVLSASDSASLVSSQITLGTVRLNVVGSGLALIDGTITREPERSL